jgi:esterase/lipase superfamily enzyme
MSRIYFVTNRNPVNPGPNNQPSDFGKALSRHGSADLRFGWADRDAAGKITVTTAPEKLDSISGAEAARGNFSGQLLGSALVFDMIRQEMKTRCVDLMGFIHGFNFSFREALKRTFDLKDFYAGRDMVWVVFTWPSDGEMIPYKSYYSDRLDAQASGPALGRGLQKLAHYLRSLPPAEYCNQSLHLMAHSMGGFALRWAIQNVRQSGAWSLRRLFDEVVLMAVDEDEDALDREDKLKPLPEMCRRVSVYHNAADRALIISDKTKQNPDRLGAGGPENVWTIPSKVTLIDCEAAAKSDRDAQKHQYFRMNPQVRADVLAVLAGTPSDAIAGRTFVSEKNTYRLG